MELEIEDAGRFFEEQDAASIREGLLDWYDANKRDLPWRNAGLQSVDDLAYSVWVSEMMLQQTQVSRVQQYFSKWMMKWPNVCDLSQASQEEVNVMWAGLGYYRRAQFLLQGAKHIVEKHSGKFPREAIELQQIPGIGKYTAGAIASIAFKQAVPAVDANVVRILCRLQAISSLVRESATTKLLWKLAAQLVDPERPGCFNQALMDLGSAICTSKNPSCSDCPLTNSCKALALENDDDSQGEVSVTNFPNKPPKAAPREEFAGVCVVEQLRSLGESYFLMVKRPENGLLAGLWEFPSVLLKNSKVSFRTRASSMNKFLKNSLGVPVEGEEVILRRSVGQFTHVFSHIRLTMFVEWLQISSDEVYHSNSDTQMQVWSTVSEFRATMVSSG